MDAVSPLWAHMYRRRKLDNYDELWRLLEIGVNVGVWSYVDVLITHVRVGFGCLLIKKKGVCVKCNKSTISLSVLLHNLLYIYCVFGIEMEKINKKTYASHLYFLFLGTLKYK